MGAAVECSSYSVKGKVWYFLFLVIHISASTELISLSESNVTSGEGT
jgi:hypothetical protein